MEHSGASAFVPSATIRNEKGKVQQAGGARVDWVDPNSEVKFPGCVSAFNTLTLSTEVALSAGAGYAHWHIVTPRQQP